MCADKPQLLPSVLGPTDLKDAIQAFHLRLKPSNNSQHLGIKEVPGEREAIGTDLSRTTLRFQAAGGVARRYSGTKAVDKVFVARVVASERRSFTSLYVYSIMRSNAKQTDAELVPSLATPIEVYALYYDPPTHNHAKRGGWATMARSQRENYVHALQCKETSEIS